MSDDNWLQTVRKRWRQHDGLTSDFLHYLTDHQEVPGAIPDEPSVTDIGKNNLTLSWNKPLNCGGAPILAYRVDKWLVEADGGEKWLEVGLTPTTTLDIYNLKRGGKYKFKVTPRNQYGWGEPRTTSTPLAIQDTTDFPEFEQCLPGELKVLRNSTVNLECQLRNSAKVHVQWLKDGMPILFGTKYEFQCENGKCYLQIKDVSNDESGRYICQASNDQGTICTFVQLMVVDDQRIIDTNLRLNRLRHQNNGKVNVAPQFTMRLQNRRVQMCYPVCLTCQVIGYPKPEISWWKDGQQIEENQNCIFSHKADGFYSLEFNITKSEYSGIYSVSATNSSGTVSCQCQLIVDKGLRTYIGPKFVDKLQKVYTAWEDMELKLKAVVCAYPAVGLTWKKNGVILRPSRRIIVMLNHDGEVKLTIAQIKQQDSGVYTCIATNAVGIAETNTRIEVYSKQQNFCKETSQTEIPTDCYSKEPRFLTKPRSCEATEGDHVIIDCKIIGVPKPEVIWLRDRMKLDYYSNSDEYKPCNEESAPFEYRLEIPRVKLDHTGAYSVIAKNVHDEIKAVMSLQVHPADLMSPQNKDKKIKYSDADKIPKFKRHLQDVKCCDGDSITFECEVDNEGDSSNIDFFWYKNGKLISLGVDFQTTEKDGVVNLHIKKVYIEDEGYYSCVALNTLGSAETKACLIIDVLEEKENLINKQLNRPLNLQSKSCTPLANYYDPRIPLFENGNLTSHDGKFVVPKFCTRPQGKVVEEGESARFQCIVVGSPPLTTKWYKYNEPLKLSLHISTHEKDETRGLIISNVTIDDEGLYRVVIENEYGHNEAAVRLDVIKKLKCFRTLKAKHY